MSQHVSKIALLGGTGTVGTHILKSLLATKRFKVTCLTRADSRATFSSDVKVAKGDFSDVDFLVNALTGQDVFIITLSAMAGPEVQDQLIEAAAKAKVKYVLPNEYGLDTSEPTVSQSSFIYSGKLAARSKAEALGIKWIGVATGFWTEYSIAARAFGLDVAARKAEIWDEGTSTLSSTTLPTVGHAIAQLLSLPAASMDGYANRMVRVSEFSVSQQALLKAAQEATSTTDADWTITRRSTKDVVDEGNAKLAKGDFTGVAGVLYGSAFREDVKSDFSKHSDNAALGVRDGTKEDLVAICKAVDEGKVEDPMKRWQQ